jgi:hypothetical protein
MFPRSSYYQQNKIDPLLYENLLSSYYHSKAKTLLQNSFVRVAVKDRNRVVSDIPNVTDNDNTRRMV